MALPILDGNQSATTLSTILSSGQHITAHTVVSLGTQAITDILNATSAGLTNSQLRASVVTVGGTVTANVLGYSANTPVPLNMALADEAFNSGNRLAVALVNSEGYEFGNGVNAIPISGTVTANVFGYDAGNDENLPIGVYSVTDGGNTRGVLEVNGVNGGPLPISGTVTVGNSVTIGSCVTHGVTIANSSVTVNGTFFQGTQPVSIAATVPVSIASVTIGNTSVTISPIQGSAGAITSFTAIAANSTLIAASATRKALTVYNAGPSAFFISPIATCTSVAGGYQVSLNSGDYWECPDAQITLAHTACFASSGSTAGITAIT